jgi:glycogen synthase
VSARSISVLLHSRAFYPQIGGLERVSQMLAEQLTELGHKITVLTDTPLGDAVELGPFRVVRGASPSRVRALVEAADLVHVNGFSVQLVRHCWRAGKPLIWTHAGHQAICTEGNVLHGGRTCGGSIARCFLLSARTRGLGWAIRHTGELLVRRVLLRTARVNVCVSNWVATRIRAPKSRVIWNPADISQLASGGHKEGAKGCFSFFGRLVPEKGATTLLEAIKLCHEAGFPFTAQLIGDGPERDQLRDRARALGIDGNVTFVGRLVDQSLRDAQERAWAVVIPTLCEEAMGLVAVEAMATGTPLIVSRNGGLVEVAEPCAIPFENGVPAQLAEAMMRLGSDRELWTRLSATGPGRAARFRSDAVAGQYAQLYAEVLA